MIQELKAVVKPKIVFFCLLSGMIFNMACNKGEDVIPYVPVNFKIYLDDPEYSTLNAVNNALIVGGGYNGIILYRKSLDEFMALDRTCTFQPSKKCDLELDESGIFVKCACCESTFLLYDGYPMDDTKPAALPLKSYSTLYSEAEHSLRVYN